MSEAEHVYHVERASGDWWQAVCRCGYRGPRTVRAVAPSYGRAHCDLEARGALRPVCGVCGLRIERRWDGWHHLRTIAGSAADERHRARNLDEEE
jgi:hypothetical protein